MSDRMSQWKYWAFISYSHRDSAIAAKLHKALETFVIPKTLVDRSTTIGTIPRRLFPVFRDREEIPTSSALGDVIKASLAQSRFLIVVCSPNSAGSFWVDEEIRYFKQLNGEHRVLALIVDGEPHASTKPGMAQAECFPYSLKHRIDATGATSHERMEPIAADVRPGNDSWDDALLRIVAGLIGVGFDELKQRDRTRRRRANLRRAALASAVSAVIAGLSYWGFDRSQVAQRMESNAANARFDAARFSAEKKAADKLAAEQAQLAEDAFLREQAQVAARHFRSALAEEANGNYRAAWREFRDAYDKAAETDPLKPSYLRVLADHLIHQGDAQRAWPGQVLAPEGALVEGLKPSVVSPHYVADLGGSFFRISTRAPIASESFLTTFREQDFNLDGSRRIDASQDDPKVLILNLRRSTGFRPSGAPLVHSHRVRSRRFDPTGSKVLAVTETALYRWNADEGTLAKRIPFAEPVNFHSLKVTPDGERLIMQMQSRAWRIWNASTGEPVGQVSPEFLTFHPDGRHFLASPDGQTVELWDATSGARIRPLFVHGVLSPAPVVGPDEADGFDSERRSRLLRKIEAAHYSSDQTRVLTYNGIDARLWDSETGEPVGEPMSHAEGRMDHAIFSPDGLQVLTRSATSVRRWDVQTGVAIGEPMTHGSDVTTAAYVDDELIATGCADGTVRIWSTKTGRLIAGPINHERPVVALATNDAPGQLQLAVAAGETISVWDVLGRDSDDTLTRFEGNVRAFWSPKGDLVALSRDDGTVECWNSRTGRRSGATMRHPHPVLNRVAFSPDGMTLVTACQDLITVWDSRLGRRIGEPIRAPGPVRNVLSTPDGRTIVAIGDKDPSRKGWTEGDPTRHVTWRWNSSDRTFLGASENGVSDGDPTFDGLLRVVGEGSTRARVWDVLSSREFCQPILTQERISSAAVSRDGKFVATGHAGGLVRLWSTSSGRPAGATMRIRPLGLSEQTEVISLTFSGDGSLLAGATEEDGVRVWDVPTGAPLFRTFDFPEVQTCKFSPDGRKLLVGGASVVVVDTTLPPIPTTRPAIDIWKTVFAATTFTEQARLGDGGDVEGWSEWLSDYEAWAASFPLYWERDMSRRDVIQWRERGRGARVAPVEWQRLGDAEAEAGNWRAARAAFGQLTAIESTGVESVVDVALTWLGEGRPAVYAEIMTELRAELDSLPPARALNVLYCACIAPTDVPTDDSNKSAIRRLRSESPASDRHHFEFGMILARSGSPDEAIKQFDLCLESHPILATSSRLCRALAVGLAGRPKAARDEFASTQETMEFLLKLPPDNDLHPDWRVRLMWDRIGQELQTLLAPRE